MIEHSLQLSSSSCHQWLFLRCVSLWHVFLGLGLQKGRVFISVPTMNIACREFWATQHSSFSSYTPKNAEWFFLILDIIPLHFISLHCKTGIILWESSGGDFIDIYEAREYSDGTVGMSLRKATVLYSLWGLNNKAEGHVLNEKGREYH